MGLTTDTHPSDSLPSTQAIQTAVAAARQWSGWREIVPCDGLVARLHDACCSGARFNLLTSTHRALQPLEKIRCMLVGGCIPPSPLCIRPCQSVKRNDNDNTEKCHQLNALFCLAYLKITRSLNERLTRPVHVVMIG